MALNGNGEGVGASPLSIALVAMAAFVVGLLAALSTDALSPDSLSYLEMAANIAKGSGSVSRILFVDSPATIPAAVVWWPPGYPFAIAALATIGLDPVVGAQLTSILAFSGTAVFTWLLARRAYGQLAGWLVLPLVLLSLELQSSAAAILSESLALMLVTGSAYLIVRYQSSSHVKVGLLVAAGAGLAAASATHYKALPMVPLFAVAVAFMHTSTVPWRRRLGLASVLGAAALAPMAVWWLRNAGVSGSIMGPRHFGLASEGILHHGVFALRSVAVEALWIVRRVLVVPELFRWRIPIVGSIVIGIGLLVGFLMLAKVFRPRFRSTFRTEAGLFLAYLGAAYLLALIVSRALVTAAADPLSGRSIVLAFPFVFVTVAGLVSRVIDQKHETIVVMACGAVVAVSAVLLPLPAAMDNSWVEASNVSPEFAYLEQLVPLTDADSLIVGNQLDEVPVLWNIPVITFSDYPYTQSVFDCSKISALASDLREPAEVLVVLHGEGEALSRSAMIGFSQDVQVILASSTDLGLTTVYSNEFMMVYALDHDLDHVCDSLATTS